MRGACDGHVAEANEFGEMGKRIMSSTFRNRVGLPLHRRRSGRRAAFTLIEVLMVIGIIGVMAGLLLVTVSVARKRARLAEAKAEVRELTKAWKSYWMVYLAWPGGGYKSLMAMSASAMAPLLGENPQGLKFIEIDAADVANGFKDPWGHDYWVDFSPPQSISEDEFFETTVHFPNSKRFEFR
jgi:prepilin-type N-terminal cleavage/methylation domain-containing protein